MSEKPQLWVFAGPNGAGRSTLVERFHVARRIAVVNSDTIARKLEADHHSEAALMLKAGRIAILKRRTLIETAQSFAIETTLTGNSELRAMQDAGASGYKVTLVFVGLEDALASYARVRERVAQGGHDVPVEAIVRRYARSLTNLPIAIGLAARCFILDNSGTRYRLLITIQDRVIRRRTERLPDWAMCVVAATNVP